MNLIPPISADQASAFEARSTLPFNLDHVLSFFSRGVSAVEDIAVIETPDETPVVT